MKMGTSRSMQLPVRTLITAGLLVAFVSLSSVMVVLRATCISVSSEDAGGLQGADVPPEFKLIEQDRLLEKLEEENTTKEAIIRASRLEVEALKKETTRLKLDAKAQVVEEVQTLREENARLKAELKAEQEHKEKRERAARASQDKLVECERQLASEAPAGHADVAPGRHADVAKYEGPKAVGGLSKSQWNAVTQPQALHGDGSDDVVEQREALAINKVARMGRGRKVPRVEREGEIHDSDFDCVAYLQSNSPLNHFDLS